MNNEERIATRNRVEAFLRKAHHNYSLFIIHYSFLQRGAPL